VLALVSLAVATFRANPQRADATFLLKAYDTYTAMRKASPTQAVNWSYLGPTNISGRSTDHAVADKDGRRRIYAAYATSGVWKTDDDGATWQVIWEHMPSTSIGDIAVAPSNPDVVWVGTGEANIFRASMAGVGIYKSIDAGKTWQHMGLTDTQTIARIVVHPTNPDIVYVAASATSGPTTRCAACSRRPTGAGTGPRFSTRAPHRAHRPGDASERSEHAVRGDCGSAFAASGATRAWSPATTKAASEDDGWRRARGQTSVRDCRAEFRGRIGIDISRSKPDTLYALVDNYEIGRQARAGNATHTAGRCRPIRGSSKARTSTGLTTQARRGGRRAGRTRRWSTT
jgi:hypothetical protein